jgi:hypothetical protein
MPPDARPLVEDPAAQRRLGSLELAQHVAHRGAVDGMVHAPAGELLQRPVEPHERHGAILSLARARREAVAASSVLVPG